MKVYYINDATVLKYKTALDKYGFLRHNFDEPHLILSLVDNDDSFVPYEDAKGTLLDTERLTYAEGGIGNAIFLAAKNKLEFNGAKERKLLPSPLFQGGIIAPEFITFAPQGLLVPWVESPIPNTVPMKLWVEGLPSVNTWVQLARVTAAEWGADDDSNIESNWPAAPLGAKQVLLNSVDSFGNFISTGLHIHILLLQNVDTQTSLMIQFDDGPVAQYEPADLIGPQFQSGYGFPIPQPGQDLRQALHIVDPAMKPNIFGSMNML